MDVLILKPYFDWELIGQLILIFLSWAKLASIRNNRRVYEFSRCR